MAVLTSLSAHLVREGVERGAILYHNKYYVNCLLSSTLPYCLASSTYPLGALLVVAWL